MLGILQELAGKTHVWSDEPMRDHTTFRVGGCARYLVEPEDAIGLQKIIQACQNAGMPYYIVGNGSNLLVSDDGYDGVIIHLFKNMARVSIEGVCLHLEAGVLLSRAAKLAYKEGLTGLEFASGIPGTVGGALVMNAGAYGGEMKDVVRQVKVLMPDGTLQEYTGDQMEFGYRRSRIGKEQSIVLQAVFELQTGDSEKIWAKMEELKEQRVKKQPVEYASAGSTFKRPEGYFAGQLIQEAGLKGFSIGDAQVSEKHCGFIINRGKATASEVRELIQVVQKRVRENSGVLLEPEVKFLGWQ